MRYQFLYNAGMTEKTQRLPRYHRVSVPLPMRLTERDKQILEAIHAYDGMLSFSQIQRIFFTGKSQAELRMRLLYHTGFVERPNEIQRHRMPEMIYWLGKKGAEIVASLNSVSVAELGWRKEPRWFQVEHDIEVNNFRLDLEAACNQSSEIRLETWIPESEFWSYSDRITFFYNEKKMHRNIRPDGYFMLDSDQFTLRFLLEIDRSTEDNPRFYREKILPGIAYVKTNAYENRFGHRSGRWLVITTTEHRMENLILQAKHAESKGLFYFTTFDQVSSETILFSPIWRREDRTEPVPLVFMD